MIRPGEGGRGGEGRGRAEQTGRGRPSDHVEENHISATRSVIHTPTLHGKVLGVVTGGANMVLHGTTAWGELQSSLQHAEHSARSTKGRYISEAHGCSYLETLFLLSENRIN